MQILREKARLYWPLIKSLQTGLLLLTGLAGYFTARCPVTHWRTLLGLSLSLFLAISGSTILNMWYDRDIDACMARTSHRPLPSGALNSNEALRLGLLLSVFGVSLAVWMQPLYGLVVFAGLFFDVVVYTIWLKRRTCWSIVWGGLSGGMPILAGRVLGLGTIDSVGLLLALAILLWIPTHILTFSLRYQKDYSLAGVPTFPSTYGETVTRWIIAISSVLAAVVIGGIGWQLGVAWGYLRLLAILSFGLLALAILSLVRPSEKVNFSLFKYASLYMMSAMLLISL